MKQKYKSFRFSEETIALIETVNDVLSDYEGAGYKLTVRQLYYQLVARDFIPNTERSYKRVTSIVNDGRLAGMIDWDMLEDRTRGFARRPSWGNTGEILDAVAEQYHEDLWGNQPVRAFVIIEKEALASVFEGVCHRMDVPMMPARGYPSVSVIREFAVNDLIPALDRGQQAVVLHFGDHDPSGIDMTRDLIDRLRMFVQDADPGYEFELERLALNMDQIQQHRPPPNPAKTTDARFAGYAAKFGNKSWELDALPPDVLSSLAEERISDYIDGERWSVVQERIRMGRERLAKLAKKNRD